MTAMSNTRPPLRIADIWRTPLHDFPIRDEILYQYLPLSREMNVLEVGPGSGFTAQQWAPKVKSLTLLDIAAGNIARLQTALGSILNLRFVCADICKPEVSQTVAERFDAAYAIEVFELLPDPEQCLKNLAALLRPGAPLLLQFPNYPPPRSPGMTYFSTREEFDRLLQAAGFTMWSVYSLNLRPWARALFNVFHEIPLGWYRRVRSRAPQGRPLVYDDSWAFAQERRVEPYKYILHSAWLGLAAVMRAGGDAFECEALGDQILNHNLLVLARR